MKNKTGKTLTLIMTVAVLSGFAIILAMNVAALLGVIPSRYIAANDVRGMAVEHNHLLYTLNFDQQNALIDIFNNAIPVGKELITSRGVTPQKPLEVEKIIIYRFNAPDIEVIPVAYVSKTRSAISSNEPGSTSLVFSVPAWNANGLLEESTDNEMQKILLSTYDP